MSRMLTVKEFEEQITNMAKECECPEWIARAYVGLPERNEMTDLRKAAEMALEALNEVTGWQLPVPMRVMDEVEDAIKALRQALAQPEQEPNNWWDDKEYVKDRFGDGAKVVGVRRGLSAKSFKQPQSEQEPVAWLQIGVSDEYKGVVLPTMKKPKEYNRDWWRFEPLYTAPPKRECERCEKREIELYNRTDDELKQMIASLSSILKNRKKWGD